MRLLALVLALPVVLVGAHAARAEGEHLDRAGLLRRDLASDEARTVAWAGWLLAGDAMPELVPDMLVALDRWVDRRAPDEWRVRRALLDALALQEARVPGSLLERLPEGSSPLTLLLASRGADDVRPFLRAAVGKGLTGTSVALEALAAGNLLTAWRDPKLVPSALVYVRPRWDVELVDEDRIWHGSGSHGYISGCATPGKKPVGFPPLASWQLHAGRPVIASDRELLVAEGPTGDVWATRRRGDRTYAAHRSRRLAASPTRVVLDWMGELLDVDPADLPVQERRERTITWAGEEAYVEALTSLEGAAQEDVDRLLDLLTQAGFLLPEERAAARPAPEVLVRDLRGSAKPPLPVLADIRVVPRLGDDEE